MREQVDKTLAAASELNQVMTAHRFTEKLQRDWEMVRSDLNAPAAVYSLAPLDARTNNKTAITPVPVSDRQSHVTEWGSLVGCGPAPQARSQFNSRDVASGPFEH